VPEGDTIWLAAKRMHDALAGRVLVQTDFRVPQLATTDLTGQTVTEVVSRGKHLLTRTDAGLTVHSHFRMDGTWHLYRVGSHWSGGPAWQVRAVLANAEWQAVGYRLPVLEVIRTDAEDDVVGHLGPDLLGPDWDAEEALRRIAADPARPLGLALLDQRNLAGVGNVYANELSFLARVPPWRPVGEVPRLEKVVDTAHRLLTLNRLRTGHVTTGDTRADRRNWVYGRARQPCRRCGTRIQTSSLGTPPQDRVVYWCPACQPEQ